MNEMMFENVNLGDPRQLIHPTDSHGNICGSGKFIDRPYLYFFDWTKCAHAANIPANLLNGRPFVCPTTQVCVEQCPNETTYYEFATYHANRICTYDVDSNDRREEELVEMGKCAPYIISSKPLFGRCVPQHLQSLINSIVQVERTFYFRIERLRFDFRHRMERVIIKLYMIPMENH